MGAISLKYKSKSGNLTAPGDVDPGAMIPLATTALTTSSSTVTFSNIPQNYEHLQIRSISRSDRAVTAQSVWIQFNSDAGTNYSWHALESDGSSVSANAGANQQLIISGVTTGTSATSGIYCPAIVDILDYSNTNKYKTVRALSGYELNGSGGVTYYSGNWRNTTAITSITFIAPSNSFIQYSHFALYGIKRAGA